MSFEIVESDARRARVRITDVDVSVVNALRRIILSRIPNVGFAFDHTYHGSDPAVRIHTNDSPLHNEYMQHRISFVPICASLEEIETWDPERYRFRIDKTNTRAETALRVTSGDIQVLSAETGEPLEALRKRWFPPNPITKDHIVLTKLHAHKTARFHAEMRATVDVAARNASFGVVSTVAFENVIDEAEAERHRRKLRDAAEDAASGERAVRRFDTLDVQRKFHTNRYREPNRFLFRIESECAIEALDVFRLALRILPSRLEAMLGGEEDEALLDVREEGAGLFALHVPDATHTEGNVVQAILFNHVVREPREGVPEELLRHRLRYIGYNVPHPLETRMVIKFSGKDVEDVGVARRVIAVGVRYVAEFVRRDLGGSWIKTCANYKK